MKTLLLTFVSLTLFFGSVFSKNYRIPSIGSKAPSFSAASTNGSLTFPNDFGKNWKILFSHPQDFTPVCSSEILELAYIQKDFEKLGAKLAVISTDNLIRHNMWKSNLEELDYNGHGQQKIEFPIIDDNSKAVSKKYGMIPKRSGTTKDVRGVFIIDPNNVIRSIIFYPMQVGRNMKEIERTLIALQTSDKERVCTPANWNPGDNLIVPYYPYTDEQLAQDPKIKDEFYHVGNWMWFKKVNK
jgi:peroxiredoxin (alkyl hydroperoxide reductase subunit C)